MQQFSYAPPQYPWDLLSLMEATLSSLRGNTARLPPSVHIDGNVFMEENVTLLPGTYIEGNVYIGANSIIGPNSYIRGNTSIGPGCRIGNGVEIKNSILMKNVCVPHLSYIGDSIVCSGCNLAGGTITANFRHDASEIKSMHNEELIGTGRKKLGTVIGENVKTGINTSIYPGRKIAEETKTLPGQVVDKDLI